MLRFERYWVSRKQNLLVAIGILTRRPHTKVLLSPHLRRRQLQKKVTLGRAGGRHEECLCSCEAVAWSLLGIGLSANESSSQNSGSFPNRHAANSSRRRHSWGKRRDHR